MITANDSLFRLLHDRGQARQPHRHELPPSISTHAANHHEVRLVQLVESHSREGFIEHFRIGADGKIKETQYQLASREAPSRPRPWGESNK